MSNKALTTLTFIEKARGIHGDKYDYSLVNYKNNKTKVDIICPVHGKWSQVPNSHLLGKGCITCGFTSTRINQPHTFTKEDFIIKANSVHKNYYNYSKSDYINYKTKLIITCPIHGDFIQTPCHHLRNRGCPNCSITGFNPSKPAIMYYLSINNGQAYKIGITNKTVNKRFTVLELQTISVIKTWYYENGNDAYRAEQEVLKCFNYEKYKGQGLLKSGNTELFKIDVLNLDF